MKTDSYINENGFEYCCKLIPYMVIETKKGVIYNNHSKKVAGKKVILYKHYIKDNQLLDEPWYDEDVYSIKGGTEDDCIRTIYGN